jgi:thiol-disulfide isomerase/thioredoxin
MQRPSDAIIRWRSALTVVPSSDAHLELGLLLHALDRPANAVVELLEGLSRRSKDVALAGRARAVVDKLFFEVGYWHPDGALGFVKARRRAAEREEAAVEAHPLGGLRFPIPSFEQVDGDRLLMENAAPVVVVALWTAACRACEGMMPFLEGLVGRYGDEVTVVALATDQRRDDTVTAMAGQAKPGFHRAWDPRARDVLRASRVPALYVVGENRRVVEIVEGFDLEVRVAIEAAVAAAAARAR